MTLDPKLMTAILAMDSYNRGYNAGIDFGINPDIANIGIGNAQTTITSSILGTGVDQADGFYAIAYQYNGEVVVSYRGTDLLTGDPNRGIGGDFLNGYGVGVGVPDGPQALLAFQFYQAVKTTTTMDVSLTGHSLG